MMTPERVAELRGVFDVTDAEADLLLDTYTAHQQLKAQIASVLRLIGNGDVWDEYVISRLLREPAP